VTENYDHLGEAIKLLIGEREERFSLEKPLRLFQFRTWLVDSRKEATSFRDGRFVFTLLQSWTLDRPRRPTRLAPSELLARSIRSDQLRPLFDAVLKRSSLLGLARNSWAPIHERDIKDDRAKIEHLNELTRCRLRLHYTVDIEPSRNNGLLLLRAPTSAMPGPRINKKPGATKLKKLRQIRRLRELFLFSALKYEKLLWYPQTTRSIDTYLELLEFVNNEARDVPYLRQYFSYAKALISILDHETAKRLSFFWPKLEAAEIPPFSPVIMEELDIAGIKRRVRRSAEVTRKAERQLASGSQ
jgi:hypothetical protein